MSQSANQSIRPVLVLDKRLGWGEEGELEFGVQKSGALNRWQRLTTTSSSNNQIVWNSNPPSPGIAMSRNVLMQVQFQVTLTGTSPSGMYSANSGYSCPRYMPLNQCINSLAVLLNGTTLTQNNYQLVNAVAPYSKQSSDDTNASMAPSFADTFQDYNDAYNYQGTGVGLGIVQDPLAQFGQSPGAYPTRGSFNIDDVIFTGTTAATIFFTTTESLYLSPFLTGHDQGEALILLQNFQVTANLQNLAKVWSLNTAQAALAGITYTSISVNVSQNPTLLVNFITPGALQKIPKMVSYSYYPTQVYQTNMPGDGTMPISVPVTVTSQNIQFSTIPSRIYIFIRRSDQSYANFTGGLSNAATFTDTFAGISNISITWDNRNGILADTNVQALYQLSHKNGYNKSFQAFSQFTGAVLCLNVASDIALNSPAEAPSLQTTKQFQAQITATNLGTDATSTWTLYIVAVNDGLITITENSSIQQQSVLTPQDISDANERPETIEPHIKSGDMYGGGFFDEAKRFAGKVNKALKQTKAVSHVASALGHPEIAAAAHALGYGLVGGAHLKKSHLRLKN